MINKVFAAKKAELEAKYAARVAGISKTQNVDMGVAFDMLISNAERGTNYAGAGTATVEEWAELIEDAKALRDEYNALELEYETCAEYLEE